jgi:hypothetical protein
MAVFREHVALLHVLGALAAGQRTAVEGNVADQIEGVEVLAQFLGNGVERQASGFQFLDDRLLALRRLPAFQGKPMEQPVRSQIRAVRYGGSLTDQNKVVICAPCSEHKGDLPLKDWLRKLRRENDPREPIVKAFRAARKAAEALLAA